MSAILALVRKEFLQIRRDRRVLPIILIMPVLQLVILGYAVSTEVRHLATLVVDLDRSQASRALQDRFERSGYFDIRYRVGEESRIPAALDRGEAVVALVIPPGYARELAAGRTIPVQFVVDGSNANTATLALGYARQIVGAEGTRIAMERLGLRPNERPPMPLNASVRVWFNPDLKAVNYMIPGVVAMILTMVTMTMPATAIVREKERGTIEQLIVTPLSPVQLVIGKVIPFIIIGYADIFLVLAVGKFWFAVPMAGSGTLLLVLSGLFILCTLGLGLFISSVSQTQQQALMLGFFFNPPMMLLSGFIFPIESMPEAMQYVTYLIPLRYFLLIIRGIFLKGVGLEVLWPQALALGAFGLVILALSARRFGKRLA